MVEQVYSTVSPLDYLVESGQRSAFPPLGLQTRVLHFGQLAVFSCYGNMYTLRQSPTQVNGQGAKLDRPSKVFFYIWCASDLSLLPAERESRIKERNSGLLPLVSSPLPVVAAWCQRTKARHQYRQLLGRESEHVPAWWRSSLVMRKRALMI